MEATTPIKGNDVKVTASKHVSGIYYGKIAEVRKDTLLISANSGKEYEEDFDACLIIKFQEVANPHGADDHSVEEEHSHLVN